MVQKVWTIQEKLKVSARAIKERNNGNMAEYERIMKSIPVDPYLAKNAKECFGPDFLIKGGYNLSEADIKFGSGWLGR